MGELRIGVLGAANIAPNAIIRPTNASGGRAVIAAIAARNPIRAHEFADKHGIPKVHDSYAALIDDVSIDAVYNPLPNGLHGHWTMAAIRAGKHVLCEKPFTANEAEAREVAARVLELLADGAIGEVRSARASFCFPLTSRHDIRWQLDLAGGALMDAGCYPVNMLRHFIGSEPEVRSARAWERSPGVDRLVEAQLGFEGGIEGEVRASMWSRHVLALLVVIDGTDGRIRAINPLAPQYYAKLKVRSGSRSFSERPPRSSTYLHQLQAFCDAVDGGPPPLTGTADAIANMAVIDGIYRAAGMQPRDPTPVRAD